MLEIAEQFWVAMLVRKFIHFLEITNLPMNLSNKESYLEEEKSIRLKLKLLNKQTENHRLKFFSARLEFSPEDYQYPEHLEILKLN